MSLCMYDLHVTEDFNSFKCKMELVYGEAMDQYKKTNFEYRNTFKVQVSLFGFKSWSSIALDPSITM